MRVLFPGRFQPFHHGHRQFVEQITGTADEVIIGIGSAQTSHTGRNPFTAGERVSMIHQTLDDLDTTTYTIPIEDINRHAVWPAHVQTLCPPFTAIYTNNPLVGRVCEETGLDVRSVELIDRDKYRGTAIRRRMVQGDDWSHLVPSAVHDIIDEIDGVQRLNTIIQHDQHAVDGSH